MTIKVPKIIKTSTNGEVDATANAIIAMLAKTDWTVDAFLTVKQTELRALHASLNDAIKRNVTISDLKEKDNARDEALRNLFRLIKGLHSVAGNMGDAARAVMPILDRYGYTNTARDNYANESAYINSLLTDLEEAPIHELILSADIIQDAVEAVSTAQQDFEQAHNRYVTIAKVEQNRTTATSFKVDVVKLINNDLVEYLRVMAKVSAETYTDLATNVAAVIRDNNERVKRRRTTQAQEPSEPEESEKVD